MKFIPYNFFHQLFPFPIYLNFPYFFIFIIQRIGYPFLLFILHIQLLHLISFFFYIKNINIFFTINCMYCSVNPYFSSGLGEFSIKFEFISFF